MKVKYNIRKTTKQEKLEFLIVVILAFALWFLLRWYMIYQIDIDGIKWLLDNHTSYLIGKQCGISTQAVDKYKHGHSDIMNMKLKTAIAMSELANELKGK